MKIYPLVLSVCYEKMLRSLVVNIMTESSDNKGNVGIYIYQWWKDYYHWNVFQSKAQLKFNCDDDGTEMWKLCMVFCLCGL